MSDQRWEVGDTVRSLNETCLIQVGTLCEVLGYVDDGCLVRYTDRNGVERELTYGDDWFEEFSDA